MRNNQLCILDHKLITEQTIEKLNKLKLIKIKLNKIKIKTKWKVDSKIAMTNILRTKIQHKFQQETGKYKLSNGNWRKWKFSLLN